ncbi:MAG TPA: NTP transferase domain-containing protein [Gemmatimonadales bacterium]|jgi:1L-myo-inositol 1-phosphate cytidylyltransferase|nr:NTP transferase domain-containing protein [Gemmatimonadales bacterium]
MKAIITAAGQSSRLWETTGREPKTLLPFGDQSILAAILGNFGRIGIREFVVVIGYRGDLIAQHLRDHENFGMDVQLLDNPEWHRGNGISVLRALRHLAPEEPVILSMADHVVSPAALAAVRDGPAGMNLLLVDPRIDECFDLPDATKVRREGDRIAEIGKDLAAYDVLDCGVFRLDQRFRAALESAVAQGKEGISDGVRQLVGSVGFGTVPIPPGAAWLDIDTPESYHHALTRRATFA